MTVPQIGGMYEGDMSRKRTLVDHGFRLPSAMDNRPLRWEEFVERIGQTVYLSATPGPYELGRGEGVVEQIIRPTGLVDPEVVVKPTKGQIDDLVHEIRERAERRRAGAGHHADQEDVRGPHRLPARAGRPGALPALRGRHPAPGRAAARAAACGEFDVLVGINLLREGLDLPEVSLVAILDADKEGFLRSGTSLIQTIGRAARNVSGQVHMYADKITPSMEQAIDETNRRRAKQVAYNTERGLDPQPLRKKIADITDLIAREDADTEELLGGSGRQQSRGKAPVPGLRSAPARTRSAGTPPSWPACRARTSPT